MAGDPDDPGADGAELGDPGRRGRPWRGRRFGDPGGNAHAGRDGGRPCGDGALALARRAWGGRIWRGRPWRGPRTTLAGTADDPGGDGGRPWRGRLWHRNGGRPCGGDPGGDGALALAKRAWRATLAGTALWHSQKRAWRATLAGTADGDGALALAKRAWRATWRGRRTTLAGTALWHSQKELGGRSGRPWHGRGRRFGTRKRAWRATLAGTADDQKRAGGPPWRGRRTTLAGTALLPSPPLALGGRLWPALRHSQKELGAGTADDRLQMTLALATTLAGQRTTALAKAIGGRIWRGLGDSQNQLGGQIWRGRLCLWRGQLHGGHSGRLWKWTSRTPARTTLLF